jgi:hypothetical protein
MLNKLKASLFAFVKLLIVNVLNRIFTPPLGDICVLSSSPIGIHKNLFSNFNEFHATPINKFKLDEAWARVAGLP